MNFRQEYYKKREKKREEILIQTAWEIWIQLRKISLSTSHNIRKCFNTSEQHLVQLYWTLILKRHFTSILGFEPAAFIFNNIPFISFALATKYAKFELLSKNPHRTPFSVSGRSHFQISVRSLAIPTRFFALYPPSHQANAGIISLSEYYFFLPYSFQWITSFSITLDSKLAYNKNVIIRWYKYKQSFSESTS